jgi:hypothetical protein
MQSLNPETMDDMLNTFEKYNLNETAETVLDSVWEISIPILHLVDPIYYGYTLEAIGDWRRFLARYDYKPKTTQSPYIKEMIRNYFG